MSSRDRWVSSGPGMSRSHWQHQLKLEGLAQGLGHLMRRDTTSEGVSYTEVPTYIPD